MNRVATLCFHEEFLQTQKNHSWTSNLELAIGYLSRWGLNGDSTGKYHSVSIYGDKAGDLHATYKNKEGEITYTMFGMYEVLDGSYSFHS